MLYSMTGFGRAEATLEGYTLLVELRTVNGKGLDVSLRLPAGLRPQEAAIRTMLTQQLSRGTVECNISLRTGGSSKPLRINTELAAHYYAGMKALSQQLDIPEEEVLSTLMRLPEVITTEVDVVPEEVVEGVLPTVLAAIQNLLEHRLTEGAVLEADLQGRIEAIEMMQQDLLPYEGPRTERVKAKLWSALEEAVGRDKVDANRFEQELIYYLEKLDFSEEKSRLAQHCTYFKELLADTGEKAKGKRLGFVLQEVGREINTLGSKASDAAIQQIVVRMKDELEKAKEQVLNAV